jgi:fused signal recognition particle receptor
MAWISFQRLKDGLKKTRDRIASSIKGLLTLGRKLDADALAQIEEALIAADVGPAATTKIVADLQKAYKDRVIEDAALVLDFLKKDLKASLKGWDTELHFAATPPTVIMVVGVNGVGKTTSIAKLAHQLKQQGRKVLLAAADTFRAAAVEQLEIWGRRVGVEIVKHQTGSDPGAVVFDAMDAAEARGVDVIIVDTAGRLHTKQNLMNELGKISRVIKKRVPDGPHEVLLVLDATTGQNAISQARLFREVVNVTGIILAKLDGTAKGGIVIGMRDKVDIPVKLVGIGEKVGDMEAFNADEFVEALFE